MRPTELLALLACALALVCPAATAQGKVAVFGDPDFPVYGSYSGLEPTAVAAELRGAGMEADVLSAAALADPARFGRDKYVAFVHLYGNTFPLMILENLRRFHQAGGCILSTGVPFCHVCVPQGYAGWRFEPGDHPDWFQRLTEGVHGGAVATSVHNPGFGWAGVTSDGLASHAGERLVISGWVRSRGNGPDQDKLFVRAFDAGGGFLAQDGPNVPAGAAEWTRIEKTVTIPPGTARVDVSLQVWSKGGAVDLDDVSLTREGATENLCPNPGFEEPGGGWRDIGHTDRYLGHEEGLGMGVFTGAEPGQYRYSVATPNPLGLSDAFARAAQGPCQWLFEPSLPAQDEVVPILQVAVGGRRGAPVTAIRHHCAVFNGATDVWLGTQPFSGGTLQDRFVGLQIVLRAAAWVLKEKGVLTGGQLAGVITAANAEPWPAPEPSNLEIVQEPRPYPTFFPKSNPLGEKLVVADVRKLPPPERYMLSALQGLVNRGTPEVYLIFSETDEFWLQWMLQKGYVKGVERVADAMSLVPRYRSAYEGVVIGDPQLMVSPNITCMIAGVRNLLPVTAELAEALKLPVKEDLRGRFKTNLAAFKWAFDTMLPQLNHFYGICAHADLAYGGNLDTYVQHKGICLWITGEKDGRLPGADSLAERAFFANLFAKLPPLGVYRGFWWHGDGVGLGEGGGVDFGGVYGQITVVSDGIPNLSVHSAIRIDSLKQKPFPPPPPLDRTKAYCAFTMSDGDNLNTMHGYFMGYFNHPLHGAFPMGWGMGPSIIDLMPAVAQWYYERQLPTDEFLADVSGVGYIFPQTFGSRYRDREKILGGYLDWTSLYMQKVDEHTVRPSGGDRSRMLSYARHIKGLHSIFADYGRRGLPYDQQNYYVDGVPVFHAATAWGDDQEFCDQIRKATDKRPAFFNVFLCNWFFPMERIKHIQDLMGPGYVWVTPSQLAGLYKEANPAGAP